MLDVADLYLDLLKRQLTRADVADIPVGSGSRARHLDRLLRRRGFTVRKIISTQVRASRREGHGWPEEAETMIGLERLGNIQQCVRTVIDDRVPGDLIETGVWRGGGSIFMRACLAAYGDEERRVWVADSFEGLPPPSRPEDEGDEHHTVDVLAVSLDEVRSNFKKYGLLDHRVRFLKGWFKDTLPTVPIDRLAVLRLDGDMYESTIDALDALYPKLSPGGFCIVDDYVLPGCRQAVHDYRSAHGITETIVAIDYFGSFWRRD